MNPWLEAIKNVICVIAEAFADAIILMVVILHWLLWETRLPLMFIKAKSWLFAISNMSIET